MSDANPFQSPTPVNVGQPIAGNPIDRKPGALTAIAVICLILGIFGIMNFCGSILAVVMQMLASNVVDSIPSTDPNMEFQKENLAANQVLIIPMGILGLFNLGVAAGLITGAIGTFSLKQKLHGIFKTSLSVAIVYCFFKLAFQMYSTWVQYSATRKMFDNPSFQDDPQAVEVASNMMGIFMGVGVLFSVLWCLGLAGFYFWSSSYISKPEIQSLYKN